MGTKNDGNRVRDKESSAQEGAFDAPYFSNLNVMAHPHRPFPGDGDGDGDDDGGGPTSRRRSMAGDIYEGSGSGGGGGFCFRNAQYQLNQPFETQTKGEGMTASLGFPFTSVQWKELERQAMIYKYMAASVPVPPQLLIPPNFRNFLPDSAAASISLFGSNGLGTRLRGNDLEPGRCKRTDGKKWRCSRDVAPDQKYCERHLHRARPRSRKPVELLPNDNANVINLNHNAGNNKKTRIVTMAAHSDSGFPSDRAGSSCQLTSANSLPYYQDHISVNKSDKVTTCDPDSPFILAYNQHRELEWLVNGGPFPVTTCNQDQQWCDRAAESSSINYQEEPSHLNLLGLFSSVESDRGNQYSFLSVEPRPFIDAWSSSRNATRLPSRGVGNVTENDTSCIPINLALNRSHDLASSSWTPPTTPGGPLAEVLNLTSATTNIAGQSCPAAESGDYGMSPSATSVSSPSGVLQRTLVSFSDGSGNSSPTLGLF